MMLRRMACVLSLLCGFCLPASAEMIALTHVRLIDGTGAAPKYPVTVLFNDKIIEGVLPGTPAPKGYRVVNLQGMTVLPGFINAHVHNAYREEALQEWLRGGVTAVRDLGAYPGPTIIPTRDRLNQSGRNAQLISATPLIGPPEGYGQIGVATQEEGLAEVENAYTKGYEVLKLAFEDDLQGRRWPVLDQAVAKAMSARAHQLGMPVAAHISHVRLLPMAIEAGVDELSHMVVEPLSESQAKDIAARGIAWVPTLELWQGVQNRHGGSWLDVAVENTGVFHRAGGMIALGTDCDGYTTPFDRGFPKTEVLLLKRVGLSLMDIIVAGTRNAAKVSGKLGEMGTIEVGKQANLLVLKGDPLRSEKALFQPAQVWYRGQLVSKLR